MADKIEVKVVEKMVPVNYVVLNTTMSPTEFYEFVESIREAICNADNYCFKKFEMAKERLSENEGDRDLEWSKKHWYEEWSKTSELNDMFREWVDAHKEWDPSYEPEETNEQ